MNVNMPKPEPVVVEEPVWNVTRVYKSYLWRMDRQIRLGENAVERLDPGSSLVKGTHLYEEILLITIHPSYLLLELT